MKFINTVEITREITSTLNTFDGIKKQARIVTQIVVIGSIIIIFIIEVLYSFCIWFVTFYIYLAQLFIYYIKKMYGPCRYLKFQFFFIFLIYINRYLIIINY